MSSMGGNLGLYGDLELLSTAPLQAHQPVGKGGAGSAMAGVGADPEGIDNNPAYWQLLLDSAWRSEPVNTSAFLQTWGARRCKYTHNLPERVTSHLIGRDCSAVACHLQSVLTRRLFVDRRRPR